MRFIAIQTIKYPDFESQDIRFWLGLKSAIFSQAWAHQAASVEAKLRTYPGTLPFELRHSLNEVNGCRKMGDRDGGVYVRNE